MYLCMYIKIKLHLFDNSSKNWRKKKKQLISVDAIQRDLRSYLSQSSCFMDEDCEDVEK